ncbi:hypothetical protein [Baekduia alba]|uniref:hypothetical protein n=1 Tax=Baekduia alba TaxID=2997333 RepID=UPI0023401708|nr:hypothetical protein [Baekduia alba]
MSGPTSLPAVAAVVAGLLGAAWATTATSDADGAQPARPCKKTHPLSAPRPLVAKIGGKRTVLGHLSVYDEGRELCAITSSKGTRWHGTDKYMETKLSTVDAERTGDGRFLHQTGGVRLRDTHHGFVAMGMIRLDSGEHAGAVVSSRAR